DGLIMRDGTWAEPAGMLAGYVADLVIGDPRVGHPVAAFGRAATALERATWADSRPRGLGYTAACLAGVGGLGAVLRWGTDGRATARFGVTAASTWAVLGLRGLAVEGAAMRGLLESGEVHAARDRLAHLCGRDADSLDSAALARASCESLAENASDAVVAPLVWAGVAGVPGMLAYRALNTLDAMVGHPTERYGRFGWAAARADDLAAVAAPVAGGGPARSWRMYRRDGRNHPSPNAGPVEAAFAGALDVRLGGTDSYQQVSQHRPTLGDGRNPTTSDVRRAQRLTTAVGLLALCCGTVLRSRLVATLRARR